MRIALLFRPAGLAAGVVLLATAGLPRSPAEAAPPATAVGNLFSIVVPDGWKAVVAGESGVVLRPVEGDAWPIEAFAWPVPTGAEVSPGAATAAQETLLFRLAPYFRVSQRAFLAQGGAQGLLTIGQMRLRDGQLRDSALVAFATPTHFCAIGTFAAAGHGEETAAGVFGTVARSFALVVAPAAPTPVTPVTPTVPTPAAGPVVAAPPPGPPLPVPPLVTPPVNVPSPPEPLPGGPEPVAPPAAGGRTSPAGPNVTPATPAPAATPPPEPPPPTAPVGPQALAAALGFGLEIPDGWQLRVSAGRVEVYPAAEAGELVPGAAAFIWPWTKVPAGADPGLVAGRLLETWDLVDGAVTGLATRREAGLAFVGGTVGHGRSLRRLVACCGVSGGSAMLTGFICRPEDFAAQAPVLAGILGSFSGGNWWCAAPAGTGKRGPPWTDPDHAVLQVPTPEGWKLRGKLEKTNGLWALSLEGASADQRLRVSWQQPVLPLLRELTPVLANLGWQEGDRYVEAAGETPLRVMPRLTPEAFLRQVWLAQGPGRLEQRVLEHVQPSRLAAGLAGTLGATGALALLQGRNAQGLCSRLSLVAVADAPPVAGTNVWQAAVLECEGPPGAVEQAVEALRLMVAGAEARPGSSLGTAAAVLEMLRDARAALAALPASAPVADGMYPALANLQPAGRGAAWVMPASALDPWRRARLLVRRQEAVGAALPELAPDFWR